MTDPTAEKVANVAIAAAVIGAAYIVIRTPQLRQLAWRLAVTAVTVSAPGWLSREVREGWIESGRSTA
jgi:hypothetical protein